MLRSLIVPVLLSWGSPALASEWWMVSSSGSGKNEIVLFLDRESMRSSSGSILAWTLRIHETAEADGTRKSRILTRYNCAAGTDALVSITRLGNNDRHIRTTTWSTYEQEDSYNAPDTVGESVWKSVCSGTKESDIQVKDGMSPEQFAAAFFRI